MGRASLLGWPYMPTHAGIMLFADEPQHFLNQTEVACVRFKGIDVISYVDRRDLSGPLYQLVDDAEQFIYRHMKIGRRIEGFAGVEYREYPQAAVREALVNAVVHRDYSRRGQHIRVFMFDDRIEVYSPGTLPQGSRWRRCGNWSPNRCCATLSLWACSGTWAVVTSSDWGPGCDEWLRLCKRTISPDLASMKWVASSG